MLFLTADPPKKIEIYENFQQKTTDYFGDILKSENLNFYDNLLESLLDSKISSNVFNNTLKVYNSLPTYISNNILIEDIYNSNNGTIIMDFEIDFDNVFSIEIGKEELGYFAEVNAERKFYCDCEKIKESSLKKLNSDIKQFFELVQI